MFVLTTIIESKQEIIILSEIFFLLTGTIKPNSIMCKYQDSEKRRQEYLEALRYYSQYAHVVFIENSEYDLKNDKDFSELTNVDIIQFPVSSAFNKGKGYQEFEMIDRWMSMRGNAGGKWIKITGRYMVDCVQTLLDEVKNSEDNLLINSYLMDGYCHTYCFAISDDFYIKYFKGLYNHANDAMGLYIERIIYSFLVNHKNNHKCFKRKYFFFGVSGSTDNVMYHSKWKMVFARWVHYVQYMINAEFQIFELFTVRKMILHR